jgi:hypothetical protein
MHIHVILKKKLENQDCSVGIAVGYGLDSQGSNPGRGKILDHDGHGARVCQGLPLIHSSQQQSCCE